MCFVRVIGLLTCVAQAQSQEMSVKGQQLVPNEERQGRSLGKKGNQLGNQLIKRASKVRFSYLQGDLVDLDSTTLAKSGSLPVLLQRTKLVPHKSLSTSRSLGLIQPKLGASPDFSVPCHPDLEPPKITTVASIGSNKIRCIFCDVDGTLTYGPIDESKVAGETIDSIKRAMQNGFLFFPATGRTRSSMDLASKGAISSIFSGVDKTPGVYQQGLMVYGEDGGLIWERVLPVDVIKKIIKFCEANQASVLAYCGEDIYRTQQCEWTDVIESYGDPKPKEFPQGLDQLHLSGIKTHKMNVMAATDDWLQKIRPALEAELDGIASLTQAVPGILEVLPFGSSKGDGVLKLLEHIGVSGDEAAALGDGENDVEMFQVVKYGIAMANAKPMLKEVAQFVTDSNSENGVANALNALTNSKVNNP